MLLSLPEFKLQAQRVAALDKGHVGIDFETTGLRPEKGAVATILGFALNNEKYSVYIIPEISDSLRLFFSNARLWYCAHNAKFELSFLRVLGIEIRGRVWDTEVMAHVERNSHLSYSLQKCALRMHDTKYVPMLEWLKQKGHRGKHAEAPKHILEPYVEQDAWLSWKLCEQQVEIFTHWNVGTKNSITDVVRLEVEVLSHLFEMEQTGLTLDVPYCRKALEYEIRKREAAKVAFENHAGVGFVDSRKTLQPLFDARGIRYGQTDLGNASFTESALQDSKEHPMVRTLLEFRAAQKRATAYWENFLELESNGRIHPSINQNRADTGRMSISDPSCQNWPTDEDDPEFPVRRAFIASSDNRVIVSMDYSQMELRLMVDEAEDWGMIEAFKQGKDFHQETADAAGVPRTLAKNGRFAKLYGAGPRKVAETLGVSESLAQTICDAIDESSPQVATYCRGLIRGLKRDSFGFDFLGRRFYFDPGFEYKYPNYRIQGGCAEIFKTAICLIGDFIKFHASTKMLIPIHDELLFDMPREDLHLIPEIKQLMISAHRNKKHLDMDVSVHIGKNFYDMERYEC